MSIDHLVQRFGLGRLTETQSPVRKSLHDSGLERVRDEFLGKPGEIASGAKRTVLDIQYRAFAYHHLTALHDV